ncbi:hypothetical protein MCETHM1_01256 [Flavobacteriaceae bacterium]
MFSFSPERSENPLWAGVQLTKIVTDSGTILPKMSNVSAPKNNNRVQILNKKSASFKNLADFC